MPTTLQFRRGTASQNNAFTGSLGELSIDTESDTIRVHDGSTAGGFTITQNAATQTLTNKTLTSPVLNTATVGTSIVPASADGATLGTASAEFSDLFLADGGIIQLGNDQDVTLTHVADTGVLVNSTSKIQFNDAAESIHSSGSRLVLTSNSVVFNMPTADGSSGQAMVTDASGNLSFAAAGATISADTSTNTDFLLYFSSSTSGALTAVKQDSGLIYNPSSGLLTSGAFAGNLTGNVTGNASGSSGSCTGNSATATLAAEATILATERAIALSGDVTGTANFDGSAGISISTTIAANSVALSTDTTGNYVAAGATSGSGISGSVSSEGGTFTVTSNATDANTGSTIVFRDGSGNFSAGLINATSTNARYADLAEKYDSDSDYEAGTVLIFGGEKEVTECTAKYDKRIAGIVSTDPAYLMNSESSGIAVGLVGRVPCKVIGEIRKGDLMVASDTPGHAIAWKEESNPMTGSVIGKALEDKYGAGADVIEVVVGKI